MKDDVTFKECRHRRCARFLSVATLLAGAGALAGSYSTPVYAAGAPTLLEEIVVTAQFREQRLQSTPVAITAVTGDMMNARSQTSIYQISAQAPNVTLKPQGSAYGPSMAGFIRGIGQYDFNPAYEPGVGLYVDDVYYPSLTGAVFDLLDLERVEILRGPQGTLAGKNSIGGAVKLYSRKPTGEGGGFAEVTYGSRDRLGLRASADFTVVDNLFARISGVSKKQEGYVDRIDYGCAFPNSGIPHLHAAPARGNCVWAKEGEIDYDAARGILRWSNDGPVEVTLIGSYTHEDRTAAASVLTFAGFPVGGPNPSASDAIDPYTDGATLYDERFVPPPGSYFNYAGYISEEDILYGRTGAPFDNDPSTPEIDPLPTSVADGRSKFTSWDISGHVDWNLTDSLSMLSITAYREWRTLFSNDNDLSPLTNGLGRGTLPFWAFSQELRLNGSFGDANQVEYTIGGFYLDQRTTYASFQDLRYAGLPPFQQDDPVNSDSKAAFLHVSWHATETLTLIGGLRYTDESKDYNFVRLNPDGSAHPVLGGLDGAVGEYSGDRVDYRAVAQYQWTDSVMTYAQFATGFKGGGINPRPFVATQAQPFDPEKLNSYEIGVKSDLFDRRMRFNVAAFFSKYKGAVLTANSCPEFSPGNSPTFPCALPINAGDADVKGFEVETTIYPAEGLMIDAALSYLDFEYQRVNPLAGGIEITDVAPYTPEWKWSIGAQYEIPLGEYGSLTPRIDASYQSSMFTNAGNGAEGRIEGYTLANARLTWRNESEQWSASLEVTNLTDKYYFLTKFDLAGIAGFANGQPGHPREWAITVRRNF